MITAIMVTVAATGLMSMLNTALLATAAMLLTGCLTSSRVWRSLDWQTIVVMGATVGLEAAVTNSGLSAIEGGQEVYQNCRVGTLPVAGGNKPVRHRFMVRCDILH